MNEARAKKIQEYGSNNIFATETPKKVHPYLQKKQAA